MKKFLSRIILASFFMIGFSNLYCGNFKFYIKIPKLHSIDDGGSYSVRDELQTFGIKNIKVYIKKEHMPGQFITSEKEFTNIGPGAEQWLDEGQVNDFSLDGTNDTAQNVQLKIVTTEAQIKTTRYARSPLYSNDTTEVPWSFSTNGFNKCSSGAIFKLDIYGTLSIKEN